jgi:hypothetical protein
VYETDKRYLIPFEVVEKFVDKATLQKIKTEALKEVQKL